MTFGDKGGNPENFDELADSSSSTDDELLTPEPGDQAEAGTDFLEEQSDDAQDPAAVIYDAYGDISKFVITGPAGGHAELRAMEDSFEEVVEGVAPEAVLPVVERATIDAVIADLFGNKEGLGDAYERMITEQPYFAGVIERHIIDRAGDDPETAVLMAQAALITYDALHKQAEANKMNEEFNGGTAQE